MKKKLIAVLITLSAIFGFTSFVAMPSANAVNSFYHAHYWCWQKGAYYPGMGYGQNKQVRDWYVHVDYSWAEETFQGKYDYEYYHHSDGVLWNSFCTS